jgi:hypothetical protein
VRFWHTQHDVHFSRGGCSAPSESRFSSSSSAGRCSRRSEPKSLEDHYLEQRKVLLLALTVPPCVSALSNILGGKFYEGWPAVWIALRILAPLSLIPFNSRLVQRIGLALFVALLVLGMFRW